MQWRCISPRVGKNGAFSPQTFNNLMRRICSERSDTIFRRFCRRKRKILLKILIQLVQSPRFNIAIIMARMNGRSSIKSIVSFESIPMDIVELWEEVELSDTRHFECSTHHEYIAQYWQSYLSAISRQALFLFHLTQAEDSLHLWPQFIFHLFIDVNGFLLKNSSMLISKLHFSDRVFVHAIAFNKTGNERQPKELTWSQGSQTVHYQRHKIFCCSLFWMLISDHIYEGINSPLLFAALTYIFRMFYDEKKQQIFINICFVCSRFNKP